MRQIIKTTLFIIVMGSLVVFSKPIQDTIIDHYNNCVKQMASRSMVDVNLSSF